MIITKDGEYVVTDKKIDGFFDISNYKDTDLIRCDTLMAPIVSLLIKKGYNIVNSSQGKLCFKNGEDGACGLFVSFPHIKFGKDVEFVDIISIFSSYKKLTEGFHFEVTKDGYTILTIIDKNTNWSNMHFYQFFSNICKKLSNLYSFIKYNLPDYDILKNGIDNAPFKNDFNSLIFKSTPTAWKQEVDYIENTLSDTSIISVSGYSYLVAETTDAIGNEVKYIICYTTDDIASKAKQNK